MANFRFEFVVSELSAEQASNLMSVFIAAVELVGEMVGGGCAAVDDNGEALAATVDSDHGDKDTGTE